MDIAAVALVALLAGLAIGWLFARSRGQARLACAEAEVVRLDAALRVEQATAQERATLTARTDAALRDTFGALSAEALQRNNEAFVTLAEARLGTARAAADGDLAQRQQAIAGVIGPLRESLDAMQQQLRSVERDRAGSYSALLEQVGAMRQTSEQLRTETGQLVTALRAPQIRGRWGELQLERAVEAAGMTEHIDYVTQATASGEDGTVRPDLVVRLVGGKNVVVDSKVAFNAYLEAMEARDDATRASRLKAHARHLRDHIDSLSAKAYWERFTPSPEFVVCFVPADAFLDAALREQPALLEHAFARNVVVATPSTLVTLLRTVAYTWRQDALAANAAAVHQLGRELYTRLSTMGGHIDKLGRALSSAVGSYNQTVSSLESRVFVTARRMSELKVVDPNDAVQSPGQVNLSVRSTQVPEFAEQRLVALPKPRAGALPPDQGEIPGATPEASGA